MMTGSSYNVRPDAVRGVVGNVVGILLQVYSTVTELERLTVTPTSFAKLGSPVASANIAMQGQIVGTMQTLLQVLQEVNDLVHRSANDYEAADQAVAAALGGGTATGTGTSTGDALAGHAVNDSAGAAGEPGSVGNVPEDNWDPTYHSPNPHPAIVGTTKVGGHEVPTYDMTGHQPPQERPAGNLDQWITEAKNVMAANGVDTSSMTDADLRALIRHESAADPHSLNDWDRNARHGIPSKGLMQTIDSTFRANSVPGHRDIWNPVDNIVAGVRYGISTYGSFDNIPGIRALHQGRHYRGY